MKVLYTILAFLQELADFVLKDPMIVTYDKKKK